MLNHMDKSSVEAIEKSPDTDAADLFRQLGVKYRGHNGAY
jgi:hypothetical protein